MKQVYKQFFISFFLLLQISFLRAQFSETIFYDTLTKVTNDGYVHSGLTDGKFIYISGSSFSEQSPIPSITKTDTTGIVIWTTIDEEISNRFLNNGGFANSMAACKSTFKSGTCLYSIAQARGTLPGTYNEIWCISDSSGVLLWKTPINKYAVKLVDYSATEILLLTKENDSYGYHIINKISGKQDFYKTIGYRSLALVNSPNILVDIQKNILISWDDTCKKFRDKELNQLLWTSHLPNNGSLRMIDVVIQDSSRYLVVGNNYARAIDSGTGSTIWYKPVPVGYIPGTQSGGDGNPSGVIVKDSLLFVSWISPYVGSVGLDRGFTLTRFNTGNGNVKFNVAHDFNGIPADPTLPPSEESIDWPITMCIDANNQIYLSGSYDRSSGPSNPGNWGIMKINGTTGAKIYESTITEDSTKRMNHSQGRFLYYFSGKIYCIGNIHKKESTTYARPLILSFDTTSIYSEKLRTYPQILRRYPSSLISLAAFSSQKMVLLKKLGQSAVIELRNTNNQLIWNRTFNSIGKYIIPQNLINLADTAFAASFIVYTKNTLYPSSIGLPDSIIFIKLDSLGTISYQKQIAVNNTDTILPVQIYSDKFGKTNFLYLMKGTNQRFTNRSFMLNSMAIDFGGISTSEYATFKEIPKMKLQRLQHYFGDTSAIYFSDESLSYPLRNRLFFQSATQSSNGSYAGYGARIIDGFSRVYSTIKIDSTTMFVMGKSELGNPLGVVYNPRFTTPLQWANTFPFLGSMLNADTSKTSIYTMGTKSTGLHLSRLNKATGVTGWSFERIPQISGSYNNLDLKYNRTKGNFSTAGYFVDSTIAGTNRSYYYITIDSSGNIIKDVLMRGFGMTESRLNSIDILNNGTAIYGGAFGTSEWGTVGFYSSDCLISNIVPIVSISTPFTTFCNPRIPITFTATAINTGLSPIYQWQINGTNVGENSTIFTTTNLNHNDQVRLILTSNASCLQTNTATSNIITMTVNNPVSPSISITSTATNICTGTNVTFTATPTNGGNAPIYQWKKNGVNVGTNSNTYSSNTLANGDIITVQLTTNLSCVTINTALSNAITISVTSSAALSITINGQTTLPTGTSSTILSTITNGGNTPSYQWQDSTADHTWANINGAVNPSLVYTPIQTGVKLRCILNSNSTCANPSIVNSNTLSFTVTGGLYNPNIADIRFYPSPVKNILTVDSLNLINNWETLGITSIDGKQNILQTNIAGKIKAEINVSILPSGVYFAVLRNRAGNFISFKFLKQ